MLAPVVQSYTMQSDAHTRSNPLILLAVDKNGKGQERLACFKTKPKTRREEHSR